MFQVEKLGRECFFFLAKSFPHDERSFGKLRDKVTSKKPMVVSDSFSYVFDLHAPPSDLQFGDYSAVIRKHLYDIHRNEVENLTAGLAYFQI